MPKKTDDPHPLDSLAMGSAWVDRLLQLFWTVDDVFRNHADEHDLHPAIRQAYLQAEAVRKQL